MNFTKQGNYDISETGTLKEQIKRYETVLDKYEEIAVKRTEITKKGEELKNNTLEMLDKVNEMLKFSGTKEECVAFWDTQRKGYGDNREVVDCFVKSETEVNNLSVVDDFWNSLAEEDKKETIVVDGKKYNKALYNFHNRNK